MNKLKFCFFYVLMNVVMFLDRQNVNFVLYRNRFESYLVQRITVSRIKRYRGFDSCDDVFQAYMKALPDANPAQLAEQLKSNLDSAQLRQLLRMTTKTI